MKKRAITLLAALLCAVFVLNITAFADFGDFSGSSDYDFSYDYNDDYDYGYDNYDDDYSYNDDDNSWFYSDYDDWDYDSDSSGSSTSSSGINIWRVLSFFGSIIEAELSATPKPTATPGAVTPTPTASPKPTAKPESSSDTHAFLHFALICLVILLAFLNVSIILKKISAARSDDDNRSVLGGKRRRPSARALYDGVSSSPASPVSIRKYTKVDPNFNAAALCEKAANLYVQMQNGWTAKNIESLRPYFTDALFTQMERSLHGYVQRGETNVVERIAVLDVTPRGFYQTGGEDHVLLRLRTRITDYTVNDSTQRIVRGSRKKKKIMTYEWDLLRPTGMKTKAESGETKRIICPGCGAPLDVNASARCPYCGTVIQQQAQDWVISAIRGIRQETV